MDTTKMGKNMDYGKNWVKTFKSNLQNFYYNKNIVMLKFMKLDNTIKMWEEANGILFIGINQCNFQNNLVVMDIIIRWAKKLVNG